MSDQHQVFGYFDGILKPDGKEEIKIERMLGFAEKKKEKVVRVMAILSLEDKEVLPCIVIYLYGEYMREKYWIPEEILRWR